MIKILIVIFNTDIQDHLKIIIKTITITKTADRNTTKVRYVTMEFVWTLNWFMGYMYSHIPRTFKYIYTINTYVYYIISTHIHIPLISDIIYLNLGYLQESCFECYNITVKNDWLTNQYIVVQIACSKLIMMLESKYNA